MAIHHSSTVAVAESGFESDYSGDICLLFLLLCHPSRNHGVINLALHDSKEICGGQASGRTPQWFACCPSRNDNTLSFYEGLMGPIRMDESIKMTRMKSGGGERTREGGSEREGGCRASAFSGQAKL